MHGGALGGSPFNSLPPPPLPPSAAAVTATGIIWSRYATQITPVNYNLLSVNVVMACTGVYHLARMLKAHAQAAA